MRTAFDYTALSTFQTCRRKYDLRMNKGYTKKQELKPVHFGKAIHNALDSWYKDKDVAKAVDIFKANFTEDLEIDDKRTNKMGEWIITNYDKQYRDQEHELVECERTFSIPLAQDFDFVGRIDKIVKWDGCHWVMDHKTTSSLGYTYFNMAEPNLQFMGYAWAGRQLGYDIKGVIVDALLVAKGLLPSDATTGTRKNPNLVPFARYDVYYKQEHFEEWKDTVTRIRHEISGCEGKVGAWYPNFDACVHFGECTYRRVCKEDQAIRQRILDQDYEIDMWDPLKKEE